MKKSKIVWIVSALCVVALCVSLFAFWASFHKIDSDEVEKIVLVVQHTKGYELSASDLERFIRLYNTSIYKGEGTGEGGTPDIQVFVYYQDGSRLIISEFAFKGRDFEVSLRDVNGKKKAWYYVSSKALVAFVSELVDEYCE